LVSHSASHSIEHWPIARLVEYSRNPRKNDSAVERMCGSIKEFGFKIPVLARSDGEIVDGHLRLKAAKKLGISQIPVILCDEWTEDQVKAFRLMVNRSVTWAEWDAELLGLELLELKDLDFDLDLTGFDSKELHAYLAGVDASRGLTDEDDSPEPPEHPVSRPGDFWILDRHRVLCADATKVTDVAQLMAGENADLVFSDPPYGVDYTGCTKDKLTIQGDRMTDEDFRRFLASAFSNYRSAIKPGASVYLCHAFTVQRDFQNAIEAAGFDVRCQLIWAKNTFAWGFARYKFQHEPIFYCHLAGQKDAWYGDRSQSTLWQERKPAANRLHPTMKPVELIERGLVNSSKAGDCVLDLFGGSGSTLISCDRRERSGRLMEIDPTYVDVIVRRWQDYTAKSRYWMATIEVSRRSRLPGSTSRLERRSAPRGNRPWRIGKALGPAVHG
jgi:DNA modification methylase